MELKSGALFISCLLTQFCFAQPILQWQRCFGGTSYERMNDIIQTSRGDFIACGLTQSNDIDVSGNHGNKDVWVIKCDSLGQILWQKCFGGSDIEEAYSIIETTNENYIFAGTSWSNNGDVSGNHGKSDVWIVKVNSVGNIVWQKCFGGTEHEVAYSISSTMDGSFILTGTTDSDNGDVAGNHGFYDVWVIKIDSVGILQWQICLGGLPDDEGWSITQLTDSGYVVGGYTKSNDGNVTGLHGSSDYWLVMIDKRGNFLRQYCLGGPLYEYCQDLQKDYEDGFVLVGSTASNSGMIHGNHSSSTDIWVVKTDSSGNFLNQKCLGGTNEEDSYSIQCTLYGEYIVSGYTSSNDGDVSGNHGTLSTDFWILKLDTSLNIIWQKCYGGSGDDIPYKIIQTLDGGYVLAGYSGSNDGDVFGNHGGGDAWILKLKDISFNSSETINNIKIDVYPNPTSSILHFSEIPEGSIVTISDIYFRTILSESNSKYLTEFDLSNFSNGIYIISIDGIGFTKVVKK